MNIPDIIDSSSKLTTYLLQYALKEHGFDPGPLDGIEGGRTKKAFNDAVSKFVDTPLPEYASRAYSHLGLSEVAGPASNKTILGWIKEKFSYVKDDGEIAWCAIFINKMLEESGLKGTGKANARSFLDWGVDVIVPKFGDIVVFWRGSKDGWQGHVGIYWGGYGSGKIKTLGGNQSNKVSVANYPEKQVLGYRRARA